MFRHKIKKSFRSTITNKNQSYVLEGIDFISNTLRKSEIF